MNAAGYYPSHLGIQAPLPATAEDDSARVLDTLKAALDPHGILAPGRYLPAPSSRALSARPSTRPPSRPTRRAGTR